MSTKKMNFLVGKKQYNTLQVYIFLMISVLPIHTYLTGTDV